MVDTLKPSKSYAFVVDGNDRLFDIPTNDLGHIRRCRVSRLVYKSSSDKSSLLTVQLGKGYDQTWVIGTPTGPAMVFAVYPLIEQTGGSQLVYTANHANDQWEAVFGSYQSLQQVRFRIEEDGVMVTDAHLAAAPLFVELRFE